MVIIIPDGPHDEHMLINKYTILSYNPATIDHPIDVTTDCIECILEQAFAWKLGTNFILQTLSSLSSSSYLFGMISIWVYFTGSNFPSIVKFRDIAPLTA